MVAFNRNHYLVLGLVLILLGLQFRCVESYSLNAEASRFVAKRLEKRKNGLSSAIPTLMAITTPTPRKKLYPPKWLGYALLSVGAILTLHAMAMKRPD